MEHLSFPGSSPHHILRPSSIRSLLLHLASLLGHLNWVPSPILSTCQCHPRCSISKPHTLSLQMRRSGGRRLLIANSSPSEVSSLRSPGGFPAASPPAPPSAHRCQLYHPSFPEARLQILLRHGLSHGCALCWRYPSLWLLLLSPQVPDPVSPPWGCCL